MKKNKGFTIAELLIVMAIIGVLVAVSIPIFSMQLRKARLAANQANARAAYAAAEAAILDENLSAIAKPRNTSNGNYVSICYNINTGLGTMDETGWKTGKGTEAWINYVNAGKSVSNAPWIDEWDVDTGTNYVNAASNNSLKMGDKVYTKWKIDILMDDKGSDRLGQVMAICWEE